MIEIQQLQDLDLEQIINLLLEEKEQPFEIYIPKESQQFFSEREAISTDYANLAYSGQLIFDASDEFEYEEVAPDLKESVCFTVKAKELKRLAEALLEISYGYVNDHPGEEYSFIEWSSNYLYEIEEGNISKIACPYFVEVSREFERDEED